MHIKHMTFRVKDLEKSIQFYETITELTVARRFQAGPAELAFMTNGDGETQIELLHIPQGPTFEGRGCSSALKPIDWTKSISWRKPWGSIPRQFRIPVI